MGNVLFSFRIYYNASRTKQTLKACARIANTPRYAPHAITSFGKGYLKEADLTKWDAKKQRFKKNAPFAEENNALLKAIRLRTARQARSPPLPWRKRRNKLTFLKNERALTAITLSRLFFHTS